MHNIFIHTKLDSTKYSVINPKRTYQNKTAQNLEFFDKIFEFFWNFIQSLTWNLAHYRAGRQIKRAIAENKTSPKHGTAITDQHFPEKRFDFARPHIIQYGQQQENARNHHGPSRVQEFHLDRLRWIGTEDEKRGILTALHVVNAIRPRLHLVHGRRRRRAIILQIVVHVEQTRSIDIKVKLVLVQDVHQRFPLVDDGKRRCAIIISILELMELMCCFCQDIN